MNDSACFCALRSGVCRAPFAARRAGACAKLRAASLSLISMSFSVQGILMDTQKGSAANRLCELHRVRMKADNNCVPVMLKAFELRRHKSRKTDFEDLDLGLRLWRHLS